MPDENVEDAFNDCVYDLCHSGEDMSCIHMENFVQACNTDYGVLVENWRSDGFCRKFAG